MRFLSEELAEEVELDEIAGGERMSPVTKGRLYHEIEAVRVLSDGSKAERPDKAI